MAPGDMSVKEKSLWKGTGMCNPQGIPPSVEAEGE